MLGYLADALSGRIRHWNKTNNLVIAELWSRAEKLQEPRNQILKDFIVSAGLLTEALFVRAQGSKSLIHANPKKLTVDQFRKLYDVLLTYFVFVFRATNPDRSEQIRIALLRVVSDSKLADDIHAGCVLQSLGNKEAKMQLTRASSWVWSQVAEIIGAGDPQSPAQWAWFSIVTSQLYKSKSNA